MSRLNYLSEQELALDGIDQELTLLERLAAEGAPLDASQQQILAEYRDRMSRLVAPEQGSDENAVDNLQSVRTASSQAKEATDLPMEDTSIDEWRQSIRKLLDKALA